MTESEPQFFIVGVGASAGGLEALNGLLGNVTLDHMAFVVVQHLSPSFESMLPQILSRSSNIQVVAAANGMKVEPNHVYVIPPNSDLAILHGVLHLMETPLAQGPRLTIDYFLRSLAADQGPRAVGVILSGTGTDGTLGLRAIKEAGGITYAQDPSTAQYDAMPRNAIGSGFVDRVLSPEGIAAELMEVGAHPYIARPRAASPQLKEALNKLVLLMRGLTNNDLSYYKASTLERRIERRLALHKLDDVDAYVRLAQNNPDELRALYKDMLISVTSFFRDGDTFDALKEKVIPQIVEGRPAGAPIRIWVPACSTGEEAYSIAITLLEVLEERAANYRIQIFGTDVDDEAVRVARRGIYPQNIALDVRPERLKRFFVKKENEFQVARRVRDMVVFSEHNITRDAPFSRIDLISCRNLFIYLQAPMQRRVLRTLHYALNPNGFLMLGTSETAGETPEYFALVDRKNKIYAKKQTITSTPLEIGNGIQPFEHVGTATAGHRPVNLAAIAERKILEMYGPPGVVVNDQLEIIHIRGRTGEFLEAMPGQPSFNILRQARAELNADLRRALADAQAKNEAVSVESKVTRGGVARPVLLHVVPLLEPESRQRCLLVLFQDMPAALAQREPAAPQLSPAAAESERNEELERELTVTKEYLQSTIEELESANEELKSSNEELQSSNEELQSTNEELETSKEELQSANEELTTVNDELQDRMAELQLSNDDLHNVLVGIGNAVVIVGMDLRIRRYTYAAERLLNLVASDVGRSVTQLNAFVGGLRIEEIASQVIERLAPVDREVLCADQRWYHMSVTPYRTLDHTIKGAVIALTDVDEQKRAAEQGLDIAAYASSFLSVVTQPLLIVDTSVVVVWANEAFGAAFGVDPVSLTGKRLEDLAQYGIADGNLTRIVEGLAASGKGFTRFLAGVAMKTRDGAGVKVSGTRIPPLGSGGPLFLLTFEKAE